MQTYRQAPVIQQGVSRRTASSRIRLPTGNARESRGSGTRRRDAEPSLGRARAGFNPRGRGTGKRSEPLGTAVSWGRGRGPPIEMPPLLSLGSGKLGNAVRAHAVGVFQGSGHHLLQLCLSGAVAVVGEQVFAFLVSGQVLRGVLVHALAHGDPMLVRRCSPARGRGNSGRRGCAYSPHKRGRPRTSAGGSATRSTLPPGRPLVVGELLPMWATDAGDPPPHTPSRTATTISAVPRRRPVEAGRSTVRWRPRPGTCRAPVGPDGQAWGAGRSLP